MPKIQQFLSFKIGSRLFGIDIIAVKEVNSYVKVIPIPRTGETVLGVANLRGYLVTVLEPSIIFNVTSSADKEKTFKNFPCIILKTSAEVSLSLAGTPLANQLMPEVVGLQVDKIGEVLDIERGCIEPAPANMSGMEQRFLNGVVRLDGDLMLLVNLGELLSVDSLS